MTVTITPTRWGSNFVLLQCPQSCIYSFILPHTPLFFRHETNQVDYVEKWEQIVHAFQEVCDEFPRIKFSLEFKPTDENTRFFIVPSTGAALLLVNDVNRPNMGLTLDIGHCLAAGENPAQSVALVGSRGKLFGMQLNDGYQRLGAEDGLIFGSVHADMALEVMLWLQRTGYRLVRRLIRFITYIILKGAITEF